MGKTIFAPRLGTARRRALLALPLALVALSAPSARAATLRVPGQFPTIASALAAAAADDTVLVSEGTYFESLTMKSGVTLRGENPATPPIVNPQGTGVGLTATQCDATTRVEDFVFDGGFGGGFGGGMTVVASSMTISRCRFANNQAFQGGAIGGDSAAFALIDCVFENNAASQSGGAIAVTDLPSPTIIGCRFDGNSAIAGGAIAVRNGCEAEIQTCSFVGNTAEQGGAIWYDFFAGGTFQNCTIVFSIGPVGSGSVHFGGFSTATVTNNIIVFSSGPAAYYFVPGSGPVLGCNDAFGNQGGDTITGGLDLGTNFSLDPLFCDVVAGDYTLRADSPCGPGGACGLIGAFGIGACTAVTAGASMEISSWGRLKSRYR